MKNTNFIKNILKIVRGVLKANLDHQNTTLGCVVPSKALNGSNGHPQFLLPLGLSTRASNHS